MLIPGILISIATFPGVIVHEFAHKFFCEKTGLRVLEVCYFRFKNPCGYVIHELPKTFFQSFLVSVGPLFLNTVVAMLVFALAKITGQNSILLWLGGSIGMHSFPSSGDAKVLWKESNRHVKDNFWAVLGYPFAILIWIASILSIIWFDLFYAMGLYFLVNIIL